MKYFANLEKLSIELQEKSSNLEEYLYGVDVRRSVRWNEIVFLLEFCHDALSASASDADNSVISRKSIPDAQRIKEIETLIGTLLIDELFLDKPDTFGSIYALRPSSQGVKPLSSSFRRDTFQEPFSSILGRDSTNMEYFDLLTESWIYGEMFDRDLSWKRSKEFLAFSSHFYLLYLALGELTDLKHAIENFRKQKLPEWTSSDSLDIPPNEEATRQSSENAKVTTYMPKDYGSSEPRWMHLGRPAHNVLLHIPHILLCMLLPFLYKLSLHNTRKAHMLTLSNFSLLLLLRFPGSLLQPASPTRTQETLKTATPEGVMITTARGQIIE